MRPSRVFLYFSGFASHSVRRAILVSDCRISYCRRERRWPEPGADPGRPTTQTRYDASEYATESEVLAIGSNTNTSCDNQSLLCQGKKTCSEFCDRPASRHDILPDLELYHRPSSFRGMAAEEQNLRYTYRSFRLETRLWLKKYSYPAKCIESPFQRPG